MEIEIKTIVLGVLFSTSLIPVNAGPFTNCKSKCAPERCAGDEARKKDCKAKCPKQTACQTAVSEDEVYDKASDKAKKLLGPKETPAERKNRHLTEALEKSGLQ